MTPNNNYNSLPIYTSLNDQNHRRSQSGYEKYPLLSPNDRFLPFQIKRDSSIHPITSLKVIKGNTGEETELLIKDLGIGFNNEVKCIQSFNDGYLIAGTFTQYKGVDCNKLCLLNSEFELDDSFTAYFEGTPGLKINYFIVRSADIWVSWTNITSHDSFISVIDYNGTEITEISTSSGIISKMVASGSYVYAVDEVFYTVIKYSDSTYTADTTFATNITGINDAINDIAIQNDKLIIAGAFTSVHSNSCIKIARLSLAGVFDETFQHTTYGVDDDINTIVVYGSHIYIGGKFTHFYTNDAKYLARLDSTGTYELSQTELAHEVEIFNIISDCIIVFTNKTVKRFDLNLIINNLFVDNNNLYLATGTVNSVFPLSNDRYILAGYLYSTPDPPTSKNFRVFYTDGSLCYYNYITISKQNGYDIIIYNQDTVIEKLTSEGFIYEEWNFISLSDGVNTWYSEVFYIMKDLTDVTIFEFWDDENLTIEDSEIIYDNSYKNVIYLKDFTLPLEIGQPDYPIEEEVIKRNGHLFYETQVIFKIYKFSIILPEFIIDLLSLARISDNVIITNDNKIYNPNYFAINPAWIPMSNMALVACEFKCNNIIKKVSKGFLENDLGIGDMAIESTFIVR